MVVIDFGSSLRLENLSVLLKTLGRKSGYRAKYVDSYTTKIRFQPMKSVMMNAWLCAGDS